MLTATGDPCSVSSTTPDQTAFLLRVEEHACNPAPAWPRQKDNCKRGRRVLALSCTHVGATWKSGHQGGGGRQGSRPRAPGGRKSCLVQLCHFLVALQAPEQKGGRPTQTPLYLQNLSSLRGLFPTAHFGDSSRRCPPRRVALSLHIYLLHEVVNILGTETEYFTTRFSEPSSRVAQAGLELTVLLTQHLSVGLAVMHLHPCPEGCISRSLKTDTDTAATRETE
ncbi:PREDICTED: uncharacterized protein LOC102012892 [Chinchilla lanigera]|uniref:uncharacterized protein LOC102012892 n=1 Tax=Chinchilla lanigera TaxID=34839 RepID=UPI000695C092|nr:PREDICTED: uncharacterized protein LOC102012892 [Chinchilla lanigera]